MPQNSRASRAADGCSPYPDNLKHFKAMSQFRALHSHHDALPWKSVFKARSKKAHEASLPTGAARPLASRRKVSPPDGLKALVS